MYSCRVPLQTLWKCGLALEKMAEQYNSRNGGEDPLQTPPATSASMSIAPQPPLHMLKPITELSNSKSLMDFKVIPSPPPTYSSLVETIQAKPLPSERLPPAKRRCNRGTPFLDGSHCHTIIHPSRSILLSPQGPVILITRILVHCQDPIIWSSVTSLVDLRLLPIHYIADLASPLPLLSSIYC